ncbi:MAG: SDR family oxidoreductase [Candidatus Marinimicrobia bacterium]|nr:SDR family oxidoreductase [Candidatus Neomarinimicrobiota bacterium]
MKNGTVLITGASRGIGQATAIEFGQQGFAVAIHFNTNETAANQTAKAVLAAGAPKAVAISSDLLNSESAGNLINQTVNQIGAPVVLVHNAGLWLPTSIDSFNDKNLRDQIECNLVSTFYLIREFVKHTEQGSIVLVSSTAGQRGEAGYSGYAATKAGIIGITKSLAVELAPEFRVNTVAPGWVDTDMAYDSLHGPDRERIINEIPLKRVATAEDVADAIVFLAGEKSRHITGEVININGGSVLCG